VNVLRPTFTTSMKITNAACSHISTRSRFWWDCGYDELRVFLWEGEVQCKVVIEIRDNKRSDP
jgi:hypothetical protein